jgi:hypothetical protein
MAEVADADVPGTFNREQIRNDILEETLCRV